MSVQFDHANLGQFSDLRFNLEIFVFSAVIFASSISSEIPVERLIVIIFPRGKSCFVNLKCHWDQNFGVPYFCIFENSLWLLVTIPNFNSLRRLEVAFFVRFLSTVYGRQLREAGLRISGSDVRGSPQT